MCVCVCCFSIASQPFPLSHTRTRKTAVGKHALQHGLLCRFDPHWLAFGPALTVTAEEIDEMIAILDQSIGATLAVMG
jgi:adenosylmethionine-8-amino-7-oxononanoate aminotransferase